MARDYPHPHRYAFNLGFSGFRAVFGVAQGERGHDGAMRTMRWGWLLVAAGIALAGWVVFGFASVRSCASGDPACTGDGTVDLVQAVVIVAATVAGSGWAIRRAFGGREPQDPLR